MSRPNAVVRPELFRLHKKTVDRRVRREVEAAISLESPTNFRWPKVAKVSIDDNAVRFFDADGYFLAEMTYSGHCGFETTRAYLLLLCKGCPTSATVIDPESFFDSASSDSDDG